MSKSSIRLLRFKLFGSARLSCKGQLLWLLVHQEHVAVQPRSHWRSTTHKLGQVLAAGHITAGYVHHHPVLELAVGGLDAGRCIRVGHHQRVKLVWARLVRHLWQILDLRRCQLIAQVHLNAVGVGNLHGRG